MGADRGAAWEVPGPDHGAHAGAVETFGELEAVADRLEETVREQLLAISPATIDRMLRPTKDARYPAAKSATRPGAALRSSIGVRQAMDEMEQAPGFFEIDLVAHSGHTLKGEHAWTLTATDVFLGWTENVTICNRAQAPGALCPHQPRGVDPQHQPDPAVADRLSQRQNPGLERPGFVNRTGSSGPASRDRVSPSRNGTVTASCGVCDAPLPTGRQRLWCSDACRQSAWRRRHNQCHTGRAVRCPVSTRATGL